MKSELPTALRGSGWVTALALVIVMAGLGGGASAAVVDPEQVAAASPTNSSNKRVTATCPTGKQVVGAGADVTPGSGDVLIDDIRPNQALTSVTVKALEDESGTTANWFVQAFAICAHPPPGLVRASAPSVLSSSNKAVTASCPAGKRVLGTGGEINTPNGQVLLDEVRPNSNLTGVIVNALEDQTGNSANWSLTAYAICANPVVGLQRVSAQSAFDSSAKLQQISCPAGKQVVGGGGDINNSNQQVVLDALFAAPDLTSFVLAAWEDDTGNPGKWSLTAYAICAPTSQRVVASSIEPPSFGFKSAQASCPAGKLVTGAGGDITGGLGKVVLDGLAPRESPPTNVLVTGRRNHPDPLNWSLRAYAICATPLPGLERPSVTTPDSSENKSVTATCPAGKRVVGAGGLIGGFSGGALHVVPNPALTAVTVSGFEDVDGTSAEWSLTAYAICASPPPGLERVSATSASESDDIAQATATCPAGKTLLGTGGETAGLGFEGDTAGVGGLVVIDDIRPNAALTSVLVTGLTRFGPFDWSVRAFAICANA